MAQAYKCDKCSNLFEGYPHGLFTTDVQKFDMCENCSRKLLLFLNKNNNCQYYINGKCGASKDFEYVNCKGFLDECDNKTGE